MSLTAKGKIAGVIGWPVHHSRSPQLHDHWLQVHHIDGAYIPLAVQPEDITAALKALPLLGFAGANVTLPHKQTALAVMDEVSEVARRIGAVNTIIVGPEGQLVGDNTDAYGFMENLRQQAPQWRPQSGAALVLGAGGAARAICVALHDAGVAKLYLANRTTARAEAIALDLKGFSEVIPWSERHSALADMSLLVNSTTLGMINAPPLDLDLAALPLSAVVTDIVYTPLDTPLLIAARDRGNVGVDGLGMLLHQARPGFRAWFSTDPQVTPALRSAVLAD